MAGQNEQRSSDLRDDYVGHDVTWDISADDLKHLQSQPCKKTYETLCETSPSSWRFEMSLPEVRDDGTCYLSVLLERTDSLDIDLKASVFIDICDPNGYLIFKRKTFSRNGVLIGDSIQGTVEMTPLPNMRDAIHRNLNVCVTVCFHAGMPHGMLLPFGP